MPGGGKLQLLAKLSLNTSLLSESQLGADWNISPIKLNPPTLHYYRLTALKLEKGHINKFWTKDCFIN